jgi:hypothetical protein
MVIWEKLWVCHGLASIISLLSVRFFNGSLFDKRDNTLEE